jgi:hypothetical protein
MRLETIVLLARSRTPADQSRVRLGAITLGLTGAFLIGAARVARLGPGDLEGPTHSPYLAESGLRPGVTAVFVVLALLTAGLAAQALRLGTAARERRLAALRLAGASGRQVRQLAVADGTMMGVAGGLLAAPIYLVLSLVLGLLPRLARLLPGADLWDLPVWIGIAVIIVAIGAATGRLSHRDRTPVQPTRYSGRRAQLITIAAGTVAAIVLSSLVGGPAWLVLILALPVAAVVVAPQWLGLLGRHLTRSGNPANLLAGVRLSADTRSAGRMSALLAFCGLVVGLLANGALDLIINSPDGGLAASDLEFYLTGFGLAGLGLAVVAMAALAALMVGVADQLVDQRRQLACLTALGVDAHFLRDVIHQQLAMVAAPAVATGLFAGSLLGVEQLGSREEGVSILPFLLLGVGLAAAGAGLTWAGSGLAGFLLRNQLRDALDPENLRAA